MTELTWTHLSAAPGGTVASLASAGGALFAATPAGIRRSADSGRTWHFASDLGGVAFAAAVAASPDGGGALFAGGRAGLYRAVDAGATWRIVLHGAVLSLAVTAAAVWAGTEADGVLRSDDDGATWHSANPGVLDLTILAVAFAADGAGRVGFLGTPSGLYRTRNAGRFWRAADLPVADTAVQALALSSTFARDGLAFAATEAEGLLRTTDGGESWHLVDDLGRQGVSAIAISDLGKVAAATETGVHLSHDSGCSWQSTSDHRSGGVLALHYVDDALFAGTTDSGVLGYDADQDAWTAANEGLAARLLVSLTAVDATLFAADLQGAVRISRDAGITWVEDDLGLDAADVSHLAATRSGSVFAATSAGLYASRDLGRTWQAVNGVCAEPVRIVATHDICVLAVHASRLALSLDNAATWHTPSTPFDASHVVSAALGPSTLAIACLRGHELVVWTSPDYGACWRQLVSELAPGIDVVPLLVLTDGTILVGLGDRILQPPHELARLPVAIVTHLAAYGTTVLAATTQGVYVAHHPSFEKGFSVLGNGLAPPSVVSIACPTDRAVLALTLGGSLWRYAVSAGGN